MPLNLCMVGTGLIATEHLKAFQTLGGVVPRWVVSRQGDKARARDIFRRLADDELAPLAIKGRAAEMVAALAD